MPIQDFYDYLTWKVEFDEKVNKMKEEQLEKVQSEARTNLRNVNH